MKKFVSILLIVAMLPLALISCKPEKEYSLIDAVAMRADIELMLEELATFAPTPEGELFEADAKALLAELEAKTDEELLQEYTTHRPKVNDLQARFERLKVMDFVSFAENKTEYVLMEVQDYGFVVIQLYPSSAPNTVENFQHLVTRGFYNGLTFHRVIENSLVQTGDPKGDGSGGSHQTIRGEFEENGVVNNLKHTRGTVSMFRGDDMNSASSQFFICHKDSPEFNGKYAAFGRVIYGMEVIDKIAEVEVNTRDKPLRDVIVTSIRFVELDNK